MKKNYYLYLIFVSLFTLSIKWVLPILEGEINLNSLVLFNLEDTQYFPIIYSLSEFNFAPTYIDIIDSKKIIGFPLLGALIHSVFFKFIGIYAFIFLEYIFQIIFLIILFKVILIIFEDYKKSFYFLIYLLLAYSLLGVFSIYLDSNIFKNLYHLFDNNFGTRYPRPLITGILIFLALYLILDFKKQLFKSFENTYVIKISIVLGLLLNTFFYYFVIFSFLLSIIFLTNINKNIFSKILLKRLSLFVLVFLIFVTPFVYSEPDYSIRIGLIEISNEKRFFLLTYLLKKLLSLEFFPFLLVACLSFYYSNNYLRKYTEKLNIFFYLVISSILSTITFISLSPGIISIYHFVDIILFSLVLYFLLIFFTATYQFLNITKFFNIFFSQKAMIIFIFIFLMLDGLYVASNFKEKKELIKEAAMLENFLVDKNIKNTNLKLFSNDRIASNLWLLNNNSNLLISDGFTNSLKNSQIEYNYINNLKHFGFSEKKFKNFISFGKSEVRNNFFLRLYNYRYQANSLYTSSNIKHYTADLQNIIINTSPFRVQNQIIPEDEKKRLLDLFTSHSVDSDFTADYIVINYSSISEHFEVLNKEYTEIFSTKNYKIYSRLKY